MLSTQFLKSIYQTYRNLLIRLNFLTEKQASYLDETLYYLLHPKKMLETEFRSKEPQSLAVQIPIFMLLFGPVAVLFILSKSFVTYLEGGAEIDLITKNASYFLLFYGILIAPIIEEFTYRASLKVTFFNVFLAIAGILAFIVFKIFLSPIKANGFYFVFEKLIVVFFFLFTLFLKKRKPKLFLNYYGLYFYSIALYFAYRHIYSYELTTTLSWTINSIALIIYIFSTALMFSFIRLKYGLLYSILTHIGINAILSIPDLLKLITG